LGMQPLANAFLRSPADFASERRFPLDVYLCATCGLAQLADVIDRGVLFRDYIYVSGTSRTVADHNRRYAARVIQYLDLGHHDLVVEVASNDGSLLECFQKSGVRTLGVEPARNSAALARCKGIDTIEEFFGEETARDIVKQRGRARAVVANNVLAHVDDTQDFLRGAGLLLEPGGLVVAEVPYLGDLIDRLEYDTVYHEHLCYFSISALMALADQVGLAIVRIDKVAIHGGSIRVYAARNDQIPSHAPEALAMAASEREMGLTTPPRFETLASEVAAQRDALLTLLRDLKGSGKRIAAYGAPAKGNTLLNYCGISTDLIDYTVDRNPLKVGTYTPGSHIPVRAYDTISVDPPDYLLILAWNFAEEIIEQDQERAYHGSGGQFILPIPQPRVL